MARRYTLSKNKERRELFIKRHSNKDFIVVENENILFQSADFDLCVEFLRTELGEQPDERLMA